MTYGDVIGCARCIASGNVVVTSDYPFANLGIQPPEALRPPKGMGPYNAVNVVGPSRSVYDFVRSRAKRVDIEIDAVLDSSIFGEGVDHANSSLVVRPLSEDVNEALGRNGGTNFIHVYRKQTEGKWPHFKVRVVGRGHSFADLRFGVCKELMHILTGQLEDKELVNSLDDSAKFKKVFKERFSWASDWMTRVPQSRDENLYDETSCAFLACEAMLPWNLRIQLTSFHAAGAAKEWISEEIDDAARAFIVPYFVVERMVKRFQGPKRKFNSYLIASSGVNKEYDAELAALSGHDSLWCCHKCRTPRKI